MGQHHNNPNAKLAKEGKLPPKPVPMSKREFERQMLAHIYNKIVPGPLQDILSESKYSR